MSNPQMAIDKNDDNRYFRRGSRFLDASCFANGNIGAETVLYAKAGRFTSLGQRLSFFLGLFEYPIHSPIDYIKGFIASLAPSPGTVSSPRNQVICCHPDLTPTLSVAAQYFLEFSTNRYPESGTYLGSSTVILTKPGAGRTSVIRHIPRRREDCLPPNNDQNYGVKVSWSSR